MKLETIERNIRYTDKPYPDIYKSAEKRGLRVEWKPEGQYTTVTAFDKSGHFVRTMFYTNVPREAMFSEYSYPNA